MADTKLKNTFGAMADDAVTGLGPSRSSVITTYLRMIREGTTTSVASAVQEIGMTMSTHEPTRDPAVDKVYDPMRAADWMKMGLDADTAGDYARIFAGLRQQEAASKRSAAPGFGQEGPRRGARRATSGWGACTPS